MKNNASKQLRMSATLFRSGLVMGTALLALAWMPASAKENEHSRGRNHREKEVQYRQTNLVADLPGVALLQDTNLVNAWGVSFSPTSPFWISDNGTGLATLYAVTNDSLGTVFVTKLSTQVSIPGDGTPTGQVFNSNSNAFHGDLFILASEDGTISGWRGALGSAAEVLVARSNAVYKGITLITTAMGPMLLAANFREGTLDAYDTNLNLVQFTDPRAPAGYAPFNVKAIDGIVFVTFARQDSAKHDDVSGQGHGLIDVFNPQTGKFHRFVTGSDAGGRFQAIDSPWGIALAPQGFGKHGDELLVGNFGSGTIMAFDAEGQFRGLLEGLDDKPVVIDGLWGLTFGNGGRGGVPGTLYFTAGPDGEAHGLFGGLEAVFGLDDD